MITTKKTVLITGAGRGVGLSEATKLAVAGHRVLINDINPQTAEAAALSLIHI